MKFARVGLPPVEKKLVLHESEKNRGETVVLPVPIVGPRQVAPVPTPTLPPPVEPSPVHGSSWSTFKTLALVSGGLGVAGVGVGAGFGAAAISSQNKEHSDCPAAGCADHAKAVSDYNSAHQDGTASTIGFAAGGTFLAAGVVLWLTAPKHSEAPTRPTARPLRLIPMMGARTAGLSIGGDL